MTTYYCPCCDRHDIEFLDWSSHYQNVVCSGCKTHPRHRAFMLYLRQHLVFEQTRLWLLHFAPHTAVRKYLAALPQLNYLTADLTNSFAGQTVDLQIDVTQIPFRENMFDVVLCSHVLEHVPQDMLAMQELFRILKPGGWAFLAVPINLNAKTLEDPTITSPEERRRYFGQANHVRYYGYDYQTRLAKVGFQVREITVQELFPDLSPEQRASYGLRDREVLHFGTKPLSI